MLGHLKKVVVGNPISTARQAHERLSKKVALAVFSSDALSSVSYATEQILLVLLAAGTAALSHSLPIGVAIAVLLVIVATSYRQTIKAYPQGGGSYSVARDNLGKYPSLVAAASLLIDYVLTVAVSLSAGVKAITSVIPALADHKVALALAFVALITLANLRGLKESGQIFALPTYIFISSLGLMLVWGFVRYLSGAPLPPPPYQQAQVEITASLSLFMVLQAFASGCAALTGIEAISDGVPAFKKPEWVNARKTLTMMVVILVTLFVGITVLSNLYKIEPDPRGVESVVSRLSRTIVGENNIAYYIIQLSTMLILVLAANTAYADFPRIAFFLARDRFLPRQFTSLGDRLVFSNGIVILAASSAALLVAFGADEHRLIPLYAVGVFLSFTLSQSGMVMRWLRSKEPGWRRFAVINGVGALTTLVVLVVIAAAKFTHGAWAVIVLIPILVLIFDFIHRHYVGVSRQLSLEGFTTPRTLQHTVIVLISGIHRGVVPALHYARSIAPDNVTAVYVEINPEDTARLREKWVQWGYDIPLVVLESPYRSLVRPIIEYIDQLDAEQDSDIVTVVLPEFVPARWWHHLLHNQTALMIKGSLLFRPGKIVTSVPYHLKD